MIFLERYAIPDQYTPKDPELLEVLEDAIAKIEQARATNAAMPNNRPGDIETVDLTAHVQAMMTAFYMMAPLSAAE